MLKWMLSLQIDEWCFYIEDYECLECGQRYLSVFGCFGWLDCMNWGRLGGEFDGNRGNSVGKCIEL